MNYLAIALATVAGMIVGWLWFGPLFGRVWRRLTNDPKPNPGVVYPITLVLTAVTAFVIAYVAQPGLGAALLTAAVLWLFVAARTLIVTLFEARPLKLWLIHSGHDLAVVAVIGTIIGLMGA